MTTGSSITCTNAIWVDWSAASTTTAASTIRYTNDVWQTWSMTASTTYYTTSTGYITLAPVRMPEPIEPRHTPEAVARAEAVLLDHLDDDQRAEYANGVGFHVRGSRGRRYCIKRGSQAGNVYVVDATGVEVARLCAHPNGVPDPDAWLAQKLAIETDEDAFLRVANVQSGRVPALV